MLRALGFLGPTVLDGAGHPERSLRYMLIAAVAVPGMFLLGANVLGDRFGLLSVAIAWAVGYPVAFAALCFLVVKTIDLPIGTYVRGAWGIIGCCAGGLVVGLAVDLALPAAGPAVRLVAIGGSALATIGVLLVTWQGFTPKFIAGTLK